jgi:protein tyrosine phosphatase
MDGQIDTKNAPILVPSPSQDTTVRVLPDEWRVPLKVSDFPSIVGKRDMELEYQIVRALTEDERMQNRIFRDETLKGKNRYRDMLPFRENRVLLSDGGYINASYMVNADRCNSKAFIASQGPLKSTIGDHWDMIWNEGVNSILTIGRLNEGTTEKIALYWPESAGENMIVTGPAGDEFRVICTRSSEVTSGLWRRSLEVIRNASSQRSVTHYHFIAWPDHGSLPPETMIMLASLVKEMRSLSDSNAVLVHCSAGVGRTGTVLAIANCVESVEAQLSKHEGRLDECWLSVMTTVLHLRECRVHIVERTWQYESIYNAIAELARQHRRGSTVFVPSIAF